LIWTGGKKLGKKEHEQKLEAGNAGHTKRRLERGQGTDPSLWRNAAGGKETVALRYGRDSGLTL